MPTTVVAGAPSASSPPSVEHCNCCWTARGMCCNMPQVTPSGLGHVPRPATLASAASTHSSLTSKWCSNLSVALRTSWSPVLHPPCLKHRPPVGAPERNAIWPTVSLLGALTSAFCRACPRTLRRGTFHPRNARASRRVRRNSRRSRRSVLVVESCAALHLPPRTVQLRLHLRPVAAPALRGPIPRGRNSSAPRPRVSTRTCTMNVVWSDFLPIARLVGQSLGVTP